MNNGGDEEAEENPAARAKPGEDVYGCGFEEVKKAEEVNSFCKVRAGYSYNPAYSLLIIVIVQFLCCLGFTLLLGYLVEFIPTKKVAV